MKRVLVMHGRAEVRARLAELLAREGYEVQQTSDAREGLRSAERHPPDLILLGVMLSRMSGREFLEARRRSAELARIPVIIISAVATEKWAGIHGVAARFPNPFDERALLGAVKRHAA